METNQENDSEWMLTISKYKRTLEGDRTESTWLSKAQNRKRRSSRKRKIKVWSSKNSLECYRTVETNTAKKKRDSL